MEYKQAKAIRSKSLSDLISSDKKVGGSVSGALSQKFQAKMTGYKEKFDPLNILRLMGGKTPLLGAMIGKMLGGSDADIQYFMSKGQAKRTTTNLGPSNVDSAMTTILIDIFSFMKKSREEDIRDKELKKTFEEEKLNEDLRRHNELLDAISKIGTVTEIKPTATKEEGPDFLSIMKSMIEGVLATVKTLIADSIAKAIEGIKDVIDFTRKLGTLLTKSSLDLLSRLFTFITSPVGLLLLGAGGAWLIANYLAKNTPDYKILSPKEAANVLESGSERDIKFFGGRDKLESIIKAGPEAAKNILKMDENGVVHGDPEEIKKAGGEAKLKQIIKEGEVAIPVRTQPIIPEYIPPRPTGGGLKGELKRKQWDEMYKGKYDVMGKPLETASPIPTTTPNVPQVAPTTQPPVIVSPKTTPIPQAPTSPFVDIVKQNNNLQMEATAIPSKPIIISDVKNNNSQSTDNTSTQVEARIRDDEDQISRLMKRINTSK